MIHVKILLADNTAYSTSVNGQCTDGEIRAYFVGSMIDRGIYPQESLVRCTGVEIYR